MTDVETAAHIRIEINLPRSRFSWVTDGCGYEQYIKFANHRNAHWAGGTQEEWRDFVLKYADMLDAGS